MSIVPFGKYKGRPIEDMLADADYMGWLEAQPWFREKFAHLKRGMDDELSRTPVHNRLQALFLDARYCAAFAICAASDQLKKMVDAELAQRAKSKRLCEKEIAEGNKFIEKNGGDDADAYRLKAVSECTNEVNAWRETLRAFDNVVVTRDAIALFEVKGADVVILLTISSQTVSWEGYGYPIHKPWVCEYKDQWSGRIEIKPVVADDYPAVLRQMARHGTQYLFIDEYVGEGATERQFIEIFARSGIRVVFKRDVDAKAAVA